MAGAGRAPPGGRAQAFGLPQGFDAYARILHPAFRGHGEEEREVTWAEVAEWSERDLDPTSSFEDIATRTDGTTWRTVGQPPWDGESFSTAPHSLISLLGDFTSTPQLSWSCLWVGYGGLDVREVAAHELVHLFHDYLLFSGPLENVPVLNLDGWRQGASYWWPDDRSWCVSTDIDDHSTYVGGTWKCVARVLEEPTLEAFPASLHDRDGREGPRDPTC